MNMIIGIRKLTAGLVIAIMATIILGVTGFDPASADVYAAQEIERKSLRNRRWL